MPSQDIAHSPVFLRNTAPQRHHVIPTSTSNSCRFDTFPDPAAFPDLGAAAPPNLSGSVPNMGSLAQAVERTASGMEVRCK